MKKYKKNAFTLVELIVVVTILGVLSTIGFVSYSGYLKGVRDSNRVSSITAISDGLELYRTTNTLPVPNNYIEIQSNGQRIAYQGYLGENILKTIEYTNLGKDPKTLEYFSYYLTNDKKGYQLMSFLEEGENTYNRNINTYAIDHSLHIPKVYGKKLGILTDTDNTPVQDLTPLINSGYLDISTTNDSYIAHFNHDDVLTGTGNILSAAILGGGKLVGMWTFDNISGTSVIDDSGNENIGALSGSTLPSEITGIKGNGLAFTRESFYSGSSIHIYDESGDIGQPLFTQSLWIKPNNALTPGGGGLLELEHVLKNFSKETGNVNIFGFSREHHDTVFQKACSVQLTDGEWIPSAIKSTINIANWNHVVCVFNGSELSVYLNGNLENIEKINGKINTGTYKYTIGGGGLDPNNVRSHYDGGIDEVYIYRRALNSKQIENLYNSFQ